MKSSTGKGLKKTTRTICAYQGGSNPLTETTTTTGGDTTTVTATVTTTTHLK